MQDAECIHAFVASRLRQSWVLYMSNIQAVCRFSSASGVILLGKLDTCPARHSIESMHDLIGLSDATVPEPQLRLAPVIRVSNIMAVRRPDAGRLQCRLQQLCRMDLALVYGLHMNKCPWVLLACFVYHLALSVFVSLLLPGARRSHALRMPTPCSPSVGASPLSVYYCTVVSNSSCC